MHWIAQVWGAMQQRVHENCMNSVDELKQRSLSDVWHSLQQSDIQNESVPIQLAQCRFPGLAISNGRI